MSVEDCLCLESLSTIAPCFVEFDNDSAAALVLFQASESELAGVSDDVQHASDPKLAYVSGDVQG